VTGLHQHESFATPTAVVGHRSLRLRS